MTFFDKKQDVLKLELTPYGKSLLSNGKLMPKYYAFFDDDILYDSAHGGFTEEQNQIKERILSETPRLRPQREYLSVEGLISNFERKEDSSRPFSKLKLDYLTDPIGTSDQTSTKASSWNLTMILGEIDSTSTTLETDTSYLKQIPQINSTLTYTMQVDDSSNILPVRGRVGTISRPSSRVFNDGSYIKLIEEQVIARIIEENGFYLKDDLEVEAFLFDESEENLIPLKTKIKDKTIVDGILIDDIPQELKDELEEEIDETYLEYYVDLTFDESIPEQELCKGIQRLKANDIMLDIEIECPDIKAIDYDIYTTRITDVEKC